VVNATLIMAIKVDLLNGCRPNLILMKKYRPKLNSIKLNKPDTATPKIPKRLMKK